MVANFTYYCVSSCPTNESQKIDCGEGNCPEPLYPSDLRDKFVYFSYYDMLSQIKCGGNDKKCSQFNHKYWRYLIDPCWSKKFLASSISNSFYCFDNVIICDCSDQIYSLMLSVDCHFSLFHRSSIIGGILLWNSNEVYQLIYFSPEW